MYDSGLIASYYKVNGKTLASAGFGFANTKKIENIFDRLGDDEKLWTSGIIWACTNS